MGRVFMEFAKDFAEQIDAIRDSGEIGRAFVEDVFLPMLKGGPAWMDTVPVKTKWMAQGYQSFLSTVQQDANKELGEMAKKADIEALSVLYTVPDFVTLLARTVKALNKTQGTESIQIKAGDEVRSAVSMVVENVRETIKKGPTWNN